MKTRALIVTALVSTGILFSACGKKESTDMPAQDTTVAPVTPSADTAVLVPTPAPATTDSAAIAPATTDSANMKKDGASTDMKKDDAKKDDAKKDTAAKKM